MNPLVTTDPLSPLDITTSEPIETQPEDSFYIRITTFNPYEIQVENPIKKKALSHGSLFGMASTKYRDIEIKGEIIANSKAGKQCGIDTLMQLWKIDPCPSFTKRSLYKLQWDTEKPGRVETRFLMAQVQSFLALPTVENEQACITPFTVSLRSNGHQIYTEPLQVLDTIKEGFVGGMDTGSGAIGHTLDPLSDVWNPYPVQYIGRTKTPLKVTLSIDPNWVDIRTLPPHPENQYAPVAPAINPAIWNATTGQGGTIPVTLQMGDTLVLDGFTGQVLHNGNRMSRINNFGFLQLVPGENLIVISDETPFQIHGKALCAKIEWYDTLI